MKGLKVFQICLDINILIILISSLEGAIVEAHISVIPILSSIYDVEYNWLSAGGRGRVGVAHRGGAAPTQIEASRI